MENSQDRGSAKWVLGLIAITLVFCTKVAVEAGVQHQVGGTPGWSLPSRSNVNYTVWASTQTFKTGDTLYFNYSSAYHNVLQVTEAKYKSCDVSSPIAQWDDGETVIQLNSSGTLYYLCGITGHCDAGQKVAVQVIALATGKQHQVGGTPGWSLPSRSNVNYTDWANTQTFVVGDTLYFNYSSAYHNVEEVTEANYDGCNASSPIAQWDDGATIIPLNKTGTFYYICGVTGHCAAGQKVAVLVKGTSASSSTQAPMSTSPSSAPMSTSPSSAPGPSLASSSPHSLSTKLFSPLSAIVSLSVIAFLVFP